MDSRDRPLLAPLHLCGEGAPISGYGLKGPQLSWVGWTLVRHLAWSEGLTRSTNLWGKQAISPCSRGSLGSLSSKRKIFAFGFRLLPHSG